MSSGFSIRLARIKEVARLGEIEARASQLFDDTEISDYLNGEIYDPAELEELIEKQQVWVACTKDDLPVGFVILLKAEDVLHIEELDVLPEYGRRGIGAGLVEHACGWAKANGFDTVTLSTFRDIPWNTPFYSRHEFETIEPSDFTQWMTRLRETERSKGLPIEARVIMRRLLS